MGKDTSSHLVGNQFDPDSGLTVLYDDAPVAKLEDAPDLDSGGRLVDARPVRVQVPSGAPVLFPKVLQTYFHVKLTFYLTQLLR